MLSSTIVLRRSAAAAAFVGTKTVRAALATQVGAAAGFRYKSDDVGDVIGIDLGTTNSCVSIMVRYSISRVISFVCLCLGGFGMERKGWRREGGKARARKGNDGKTSNMEWNKKPNIVP